MKTSIIEDKMIYSIYVALVVLIDRFDGWYHNQLFKGNPLADGLIIILGEMLRHLYMTRVYCIANCLFCVACL